MGGYEFIQQALSKSTSPVSLVVYHGVEFMENEFYDQLKSNIKMINGENDYSNVVGKKIKTNGFISTTINKEWAQSFSDGSNWLNNNKKEPPFGEPVMFEISFKKGTDNIAYISGFPLIKQNGINMINSECSFLINIGSEFEITGIKKEGNVNIFEMNLL